MNRLLRSTVVLLVLALAPMRAANDWMTTSSSPFLREQAAGLVQWQPWSAEVLARAKAENKPVYVFAGFFLNELSRATLRQTFSNADAAGYVNSRFICVIVDRDEQADVAACIQNYLHTAKQVDGWPAHIWFTPDFQPFEGAGYLPPTEEWGKPGFLKVVQQAADGWKADAAAARARAAESIALLATALQPLPSGVPEPEKSRGRLSAAADAWRAHFDSANGGFSDPPKYPEPELLRFLLKRSPTDRDLALTNLRMIANSALRDPIDGGFFRYSTDAAWHLPYQQKTAVDQARIALAFLDAAKVSGDAALGRVAAGALDYSLARLVRPDGGLAAAEDGTRDENAAYFAWTAEEIDAALGAASADFKKAHGIEAAGNVSADDDPSGRLKGKNLLRSNLAADPASATSLAKLRSLRDKRPALLRDERGTAGAHGLMLAALAQAGVELHEPRFLEGAQRIFAVIQKDLAASPDGRLRRHRGSNAPAVPFDYAAVALGCRELATATHANDAAKMADRELAYVTENFYAPSAGRFYATPKESPAGIFARPPAIGEPLSAEALALFAGAAPEQAKAIAAALSAPLDDDPLAPGDVLLSLSK
jgi:uncharacterized protein YyaL (SSP411 family)